MALESERKYINVDFKTLRKFLTNLDSLSEGLHFEENLLFDTQDRSLVKNDRLFRLRRQKWTNREQIILTLKLPPKVSETRAKVREELETRLDDWKTGQRILENLGYSVIARYEKTRERFKLELDGQAVNIDLDHLPFGDCVEIEASPEIIDQVAYRLHLDKFKLSIKSYYDLHLEWLRLNNLPPTSEILFEGEEKRSLQKQFKI